jgi:hypothetical protein
VKSAHVGCITEVWGLGCPKPKPLQPQVPVIGPPDMGGQVYYTTPCGAAGLGFSSFRRPLACLMRVCRLWRGCLRGCGCLFAVVAAVWVMLPSLCVLTDLESCKAMGHGDNCGHNVKPAWDAAASASYPTGVRRRGRLGTTRHTAEQSAARDFDRVVLGAVHPALHSVCRSEVPRSLLPSLLGGLFVCVAANCWRVHRTCVLSVRLSSAVVP